MFHGNPIVTVYRILSDKEFVAWKNETKKALKNFEIAEATKKAASAGNRLLKVASEEVSKV